MTQSTKKRPKATREQTQARGDDRRPRRYSAQMRANAMSLVRRRRAEGIRLGACAEELGISTVTLRKWLKAADGTAATQSAPSASPWRKVALSASTSPGITDAQLSLTTPSGYRLEGLSLEQALLALGRLP